MEAMVLCLAKGLRDWGRFQPRLSQIYFCSVLLKKLENQPGLFSKQISTGINNYYWNTTWKVLMNQDCHACSLSCLFNEPYSFISLTWTRTRAIFINDRNVEAKSFYLTLDRFYFSSSTLVLFPYLPSLVFLCSSIHQIINALPMRPIILNCLLVAEVIFKINL